MFVVTGTDIAVNNMKEFSAAIKMQKYEGWNFNSGNYLFTTDTK